jgi:hypothetical protein
MQLRFNDTEGHAPESCDQVPFGEKAMDLCTS